MKKIIILLITIACTSSVFAQMDIATAREQDEESVVTVTGVVTNGDEIGSPIRYIEDGTAGIAIYDPENTEGVNRGDSITVTGVLIDYNGLLEIQPVNNLINHGSGYSITVQLITPNDIGESTESELVTIEEVVFENAGQLFSVGTHNFSVGGQSGIIYVKAGCDIENTLIPSCPVKMTAISSQYSFTGFDGYQLLVRDENDFEFNGGICYNSALTQSDITTSSFIVNFTTNYNAYSELRYGLTTDLELGTVYSDSGYVQNHAISLDNLEAGSIYYVQALSSEGPDSAYSAVFAFATQSTSSGEIRVCFNNPVDISVATIENAQYSGVYTKDSIKAYIDKADSTLDIAVYNHSDAMITSAINDAYERGVRVRYITCESTTTAALGSLNSDIPWIERPEGMGIMHNKFIVIELLFVETTSLISKTPDK